MNDLSMYGFCSLSFDTISFGCDDFEIWSVAAACLILRLCYGHGNVMAIFEQIRHVDNCCNGDDNSHMTSPSMIKQ